MKQTQHCVVSVFLWADQTIFWQLQSSWKIYTILQKKKKKREDTKKICRKGDCSFEKNMV